MQPLRSLIARIKLAHMDVIANRTVERGGSCSANVGVQRIDVNDFPSTAACLCGSSLVCRTCFVQ
jgi:hypothetical protein